MRAFATTIQKQNALIILCQYLNLITKTHKLNIYKGYVLNMYSFHKHLINMQYIIQAYLDRKLNIIVNKKK